MNPRLSPVWLVILMSCLGHAQVTGEVEGFIGFAGEYPSTRTLRVTQDQDVCGHKKVDEAFAVDPETRGLANVVVYWTRPSPSDARSDEEAIAVLAQSQCRYEPHVQVGRAGATLEIVNNDGILHNIHAYNSEDETLFNIAQPGIKKSMKQNLPSGPGVINFKCDVHSWMNGYLLLLDNAVHAITDSTGRYRLDDIFLGDQEIHIWHERLGHATRRVQVESEKPAVFDLVIEPNR